MSDCRIVQGNCLEALKPIESESVDAVISDPPYPQVDREYGVFGEDEWHQLMRGVVTECRRILKPSGSMMFVLQPNSFKVGRMRPWLWEFMAWTTREIGMVQDAWWWNMTTPPAAGATRGGLMRGSIKACVWLGEPNCYRNQDEVLWKESDGNKARRWRARAERIYRPSGHNMNEQKCCEAALRRGGVTPFNVIPIMGEGGKGHPAATPLRLCEWWVRYISPPGGLVVDPFNGSGTVGVACVKLGRRYVGIEREPRYVEISERRIRRAKKQYYDIFAA